VLDKLCRSNEDNAGRICKRNFADEIQFLCSEVASNDFVQAVLITKGHDPSVVLCNSDQIKDLKWFCSKSVPESLRSLLCVDRIFNLSLFVKVTVFKYKAVLC